MYQVKLPQKAKHALWVFTLVAALGINVSWDHFQSSEKAELASTIFVNGDFITVNGTEYKMERGQVGDETIVLLKKTEASAPCVAGLCNTTFRLKDTGTDEINKITKFITAEIENKLSNKQSDTEVVVADKKNEKKDDKKDEPQDCDSKNESAQSALNCWVRSCITLSKKLGNKNDDMDKVEACYYNHIHKPLAKISKTRKQKSDLNLALKLIEQLHDGLKSSNSESVLDLLVEPKWNALDGLAVIERNEFIQKEKNVAVYYSNALAVEDAALRSRYIETGRNKFDGLWDQYESFYSDFQDRIDSLIWNDSEDLSKNYTLNTLLNKPVQEAGMYLAQMAKYTLPNRMYDGYAIAAADNLKKFAIPEDPAASIFTTRSAALDDRFTSKYSTMSITDLNNLTGFSNATLENMRTRTPSIRPQFNLAPSTSIIPNAQQPQIGTQPQLLPQMQPQVSQQYQPVQTNSGTRSPRF